MEPDLGFGYVKISRKKNNTPITYKDKLGKTT
jgi:hypothetical protein